jgi:hypothetical protein
MIMKKNEMIVPRNNKNNDDDNERDYYCDANIGLQRDGFFDIRIIVDRIH